MAPFAKMFDSLKLGIYNKYSENPAKLMIFAGTLSWILSCAAQVGALVFNDKLTSKDRKFLIPQELADGAVNVGLFLGITTALQRATEKNIENGKIMFGEMKKPISDALKSSKMTLEQALAKNEGKISKILTNQADLNKFVKLKGGASLATALLGSIVSCNILTPVIRNAIGARWQKRLTNWQDQAFKEAGLTPTQPLAVKLNQNSDRKINKPSIYNNFYTSSNLKI